MPIVVSEGALENIQPGWWPVNSGGSIRFYNQYSYDYATIYRTQPNVRTCVDFLARNIAQLGLHVFERMSDTDRIRVIDGPFAKALSNPLPAKYKVTRYRLIESLISDLGIYFNAYWIKIRGEDFAMGLLRVPPQYMHVEGGLYPQKYELRVTGKPIPIDAENVVHFRGYNPDSSIVGLSPLETLRRILAEEHAAGNYRENFWKNSARISGIVERPAEAPDWNEAAINRFIAEFKDLYTGEENTGQTAVLEDGMTWKPITFNAQQSEYLQGRKLTREECARAYHIPLPLVGILDHATFSNIKEQHKNLYQDSLGPWLRAVEEDIELQLKFDFPGTENQYAEFNIAEKLAGSFEDQTQAYQAAVGRPWMTANEARARQNMPQIEGGDELVTPLNVLVGGQASPRDSAPPPKEKKGVEIKAIDPHIQELRERHEKKWRAILGKHYKRQEASILPHVGKAAKVDIGGVWWDADRWNSELYADLLPLNTMTAKTWADLIIALSGSDEEMEDYQIIPWLEEHSRIQSEYINQKTMDEISVALKETEPLEAVKGVFLAALTVWAAEQAITAVTSALNFGSTEGASRAGLRSKTWQTNSKKPRDAHLAMSGETVGIRERFSNGAKWPGDPVLGAEGNSNCRCSVVFGK